MLGLLLAVCSDAATTPTAGAGIWDVTGPAAEVNMMGYAVLSQTTAGVHLRLRARAFVFTGSNSKKVAFVSLDAGMASTEVTRGVVESLQAKHPTGGWTYDNVLISGTHSHSGPAGFFQYVLYEFTSLGFVNETATAFVNGIVSAIEQADGRARPATAALVAGLLGSPGGGVANSNINRSPSSYLLNPADERSAWAAEGDTDKKMTLLKIDSAASTATAGTTGPVTTTPIGTINWFAVHCTSMNNTNHLISGDNKGYASFLFERAMNPPSTPAGHGAFVAAFAQSNLGDVSPNTRGPHCQDTGLPCDVKHSTCDNSPSHPEGKNEKCIASGPGKDMFESTQIIGERQFEKARELYTNASEKGDLVFGVPPTAAATAPVDTSIVSYVHTWVHMPTLVVQGPLVPVPGMTPPTGPNGSTTLCKPSMGYAFAAGTTDGPGAFDFTQGENSTNPLWNIVVDLIHKPSAELVACQLPKPILLPTGEIDTPYAWDPATLPLQLLRVGSLVIIAAPTEFTTMAGRRVRAAVLKALGGSEMGWHVVLAGLSNTYASYTCTPEEYGAQRYEAASTLFGPHTLSGYIQEYIKLAVALVSGAAVDPGTPPPDYRSKQISLLAGVVVDTVPGGQEYGDVTVAPAASYAAGATISVEFQSANPRNNQRIQGTFLAIEQLAADGKTWNVIATDGDWSTKFAWRKGGGILGSESLVTVTWTPGTEITSGNYRIRHFGTHKNLFGKKTDFEGVSEAFAYKAAAPKGGV